MKDNLEKMMEYIEKSGLDGDILITAFKEICRVIRNASSEQNKVIENCLKALYLACCTSTEIKKREGN